MEGTKVNSKRKRRRTATKKSNDKKTTTGKGNGNKVRKRKKLVGRKVRRFKGKAGIKGIKHFQVSGSFALWAIQFVFFKQEPVSQHSKIIFSVQLACSESY